MPNYKIVDSDKLDSDLTIVADAIRAKGGTADALLFPDGMKTAIENIKAGGGGMELNIAYGDTPPEDTTKLWVKTSEPSAVKINGTMGQLSGGETYKTISTVLPSNVAYTSACAVGENIYIFGGYDGTNFLNTIWRFDTTTKTISVLSATLPTGKCKIGVASVGSLIYLCGGQIATVRTSGSQEIYCFDTKQETVSLTEMTVPKSTYAPTVAIWGTELWLVGSTESKNAEYYDLISGVKTKSNFVPDSYSTTGSSVYVYNNYLYVFGGYRTLGQVTPLNRICKFDLVVRAVTENAGTLISAICHQASIKVGSYVYLFGGIADTGFATTASGSVWRYDLDTETITALPSMNAAKKGVHSAVAVGDVGYIFGGEMTADIVEFQPNLTTPLATNNLHILSNTTNNKFNIINTNTAQVEIGVNKVYKGNADGIAEETEAALYNGTEWVTI